jgi:hypothetical protein
MRNLEAVASVTTWANAVERQYFSPVMAALFLAGRDGRLLLPPFIGWSLFDCRRQEGQLGISISRRDMLVRP